MFRKATFIKLFFSLMVIIGSFQSYAKVFSSRHFTTEHGLPSSEVYSVLQDNEGYMWFATDRGALRFDGNEFEVFTSKDGLSNTVILRLYKDHDGRIWFVDIDAQLSYYENGKFHLYPYNDAIKKETLSAITTSFCIDSEYNVHLGLYYSGYLKIDRYGKTFKKNNFKYRSHLQRVGNQLLRIRNIKSEYDNKINYNDGTENKILSLDKIKEHYHNVNATTLIKNNTFHFSVGVHLFYYANDTTKELHRFSNTILNLFETKDQIWIGFLKNGYSILDKKTGEITDHNSLNKNSVSNFYKDKENGFWITTLDNGIYYYPNTSLRTYTIADGLSSNVIYSLVGNKTYLATKDYGGDIAIMNLLSQKIERIIKPTHTLGMSKKILQNPTNDRLYISVKNELIDLISDSVVLTTQLSIQLKTFMNDTTFLSIKTVQNKQTFGIYQSGKFTSFNIEKALDYQYNLHLLILKKTGRILVGHKTGLHEIVKEKEKYSLINLGDHHPLFSTRVTKIVESNEYDFIVATRGEGVLFVKNNIPFALKKKHGLLSNHITSLFIDSSNTVWVGSAKGLSIINPEKEITNIKWEDGLISNEVTDIFVDKERAYIGTKKGLTVLNKKSIVKDSINIPVLFKKITLDNNQVIQPKDNTITIDFNEPVLNIKFVGISYKSMGRVNYKYRLNRDENWQYTTNNKLQFINLSSGEYHLEIYASNGESEWSKEPALLTINVTHPFWKTLPFIFFSIIIFAFLLFLIYKSSLIRVKKREMLKRQIQSLRFEALSAQMNPHFIFNSLNSIQNFIMMNEKKESVKYLSKFAKLMRKTLDHSQSKNISLEEEKNALILYLDLEALRFDGLIKYEIELGLDIDTANIILPALLIQPIVENAILHGLRPKPEGGLIKITFHKKNVQLVIKIEDNGVGRKIARKNKEDGIHQSKGNSLTKDRVALFAKEFYANYIYEIEDLMADGEGIGTIVRIGIPYIVKKHDNTQSNNNR